MTTNAPAISRKLPRLSQLKGRPLTGTERQWLREAAADTAASHPQRKPADIVAALPAILGDASKNSDEKLEAISQLIRPSADGEPVRGASPAAAARNSGVGVSEGYSANGTVQILESHKRTRLAGYRR